MIGEEVTPDLTEKNSGRDPYSEKLRTMPLSWEILNGYGFGRFQKGPVFPSPASVVIISRAYSRLRETQSRSKRLRK